MPSFVRLPRNDAVINATGPYMCALNLGDGTTEMQRTVVRTGLARFEPGTQATLLTLVQRAAKPMDFFDVGGHIGLHSLIIGAVFPSSAVHITAFEPTPRTSRIFRSLAAANRLQIRIERAAVSSEDGTAELYISPWDTSNSLTKGFREARDVVVVPTMTLDRYCAEHGRYPRVMKIDVETFEAQVILGALGAIERSRPSIVCEVLPDADRDGSARAMAGLTKLGYHVHKWSRDNGWRECTVQDVIDQVSHDGKDWLFTPEKLDSGFHRSLSEWQSAIAECNSETSSTLAADRTGRSAPRHELAAAASKVDRWTEAARRLISGPRASG